MQTLSKTERNILDHITIVLVDPRIPDNIGLTARVMKNTGFRSLSIVSSRVSSKANEVAKRAKDIIENARVFPTLKEALADSHYTFATTRRVRKNSVAYHFPDILPTLIAHAKRKNISILFGREDFGLSHEDISLCDSIITLPADPDFPSYNLASAVGIVCYEIMQTLLSLAAINALTLAPGAQIEALLSHIETLLCSRVPSQKRPSMIRSLRRILTRTHLTKNEVSLLEGILHRLG